MTDGQFPFYHFDFCGDGSCGGWIPSDRNKECKEPSQQNSLLNESRALTGFKFDGYSEADKRGAIPCNVSRMKYVCQARDYLWDPNNEYQWSTPVKPSDGTPQVYDPEIKQLKGLDFSGLFSNIGGRHYTQISPDEKNVLVQYFGKQDALRISKQARQKMYGKPGYAEFGGCFYQYQNANQNLQKFKHAQQQIKNYCDQVDRFYSEDDHKTKSIIYQDCDTGSWRDSESKKNWKRRVMIQSISKIDPNKDYQVKLPNGDKTNIQVPFYYAPDYEDQGGDQNNINIADKQYIQELALWTIKHYDQYKDYIFITNNQRFGDIMQMFLARSEVAGYIDNQVTTYCKVKPSDPVCSCSDDGMKYWFGTTLPAPYCAFGTCKTYGYKYGSFIQQLDKQCPDISTCTSVVNIQKNDNPQIGNVALNCNIQNTKTTTQTKNIIQAAEPAVPTVPVSAPVPTTAPAKAPAAPVNLSAAPINAPTAPVSAPVSTTVSSSTNSFGWIIALVVIICIAAAGVGLYFLVRWLKNRKQQEEIIDLPSDPQQDSIYLS